jgi:prepilin-type N-terminal cleavage/methylation domain-containing protein
MRTTVKTSSAPAFSLVELLVVIAILAVLVSLLLPSLRMARFQAKIVMCMGQYKQMALASRMYAVDNKGWLFEKTSIRQEYLTESLVSNEFQSVGIMAWYPYLNTSKAYYCPDAPTNGAFAPSNNITKAFTTPVTGLRSTFVTPRVRFGGTPAGGTYNRYVAREAKPTGMYISGKLDDNLSDSNGRQRPILVDTNFFTPTYASQYAAHSINPLYGGCHEGQFSPVLYADGTVLQMKEDFANKFYWGYLYIGESSLSWHDGSDWTALMAVRQ